MSTEATISLIRSGVLVPATMARHNGPGLRVTVTAWAADLGISGSVYGCGPYRAQLQLDESDVNELCPHRAACDISGWQQQAAATAYAVEKFQRVVGARVRVTGKDGILTFVWVK